MRRGADLRVVVTDTTSGETAVDWPPSSQLTTVYRSQLSPDGSAQQMTLVGVNPDAFNEIARYPRNFTSITIPSVTGALAPDSTAPTDAGVLLAIPAVFSREALPSNKGVGDELNLLLPTRRRQVVTFEIRGVISNFPTIDGSFFVTDLEQIERALGEEVLAEIGSFEEWIKLGRLETWESESLQQSMSQAQVLASRQDEMAILQAGLLGQSLLSGLRWLMWGMIVVSLLVIVLMRFVTVGERPFEFSIWQSMGATRRGRWETAVWEGVLLLLVGMVVGTAVVWLGNLLIWPLLQVAVAGAEVVVSGTAVVILFMLVAACDDCWN